MGACDNLGLFDDDNWDDSVNDIVQIKSDKKGIPTLFDHLKNLTSNKVPWNDEPGMMKSYNQYMINKFVSMDDRFLMIVDVLNQMQDLPDKIHYDMLFNYLPKEYVHFAYIGNKNKKAEMDKIKIVASYYRVPLTEAEDFMSMIPEEILDELYELHKTSEEINNV